MSFGINMNIGDGTNNGFTVKTMQGCRVVFGEIPISQFGMLSQGFSRKAVMATDIADRIGASFVIGEPDSIEALRNSNLPVSDKRQREAQLALDGGLIDVADWLRTGERGNSSNAMAKHIFGLSISAGIDHPCDPDDLLRCIRFVNTTKSRDRVHLMSQVSPEWARLVATWDDLVVLLNEELTGGKTASKTYAMMNETIESK